MPRLFAILPREETRKGDRMRRGESDTHKLVRLANELDRGQISSGEYVVQVNEIMERTKARQTLTKLLRPIDAKYGKGRRPVVQGGLPELGKKR